MSPFKFAVQSPPKYNALVVRGPKGDKGDTGADGPSNISDQTLTDLAGLLAGDGEKVGVLSAPAGRAFLEVSSTAETQSAITAALAAYTPTSSLAAIATSGSASDLIIGTLANARLTPQVVRSDFSYPDPSWVTSLAASKLIGTILDARLSSNVPLKDAATNAFTGSASFGGMVQVGPSGPLLKNSFGALHVRNSTDSAFADARALRFFVGTNNLEISQNNYSVTLPRLEVADFIAFGTAVTSLSRLAITPPSTTTNAIWIVNKIGQTEASLRITNNAGVTSSSLNADGGATFNGAVSVAGSTILNGQVTFRSDIWHRSLTDTVARLYFSINGPSYYNGGGTGVVHEFRNTANMGLVRISNSGELRATSGIAANNGSADIAALGPGIAYYGLGHTALYTLASGVGPQIYLGDANFGNSAYWNSAPGIGAVGGTPTSELAFFVYQGAANSRSEAGRFLNNLQLQLNGTLKLGGSSGLVIRDNAGTIEIRNSANNALGPIRATSINASVGVSILDSSTLGQHWLVYKNTGEPNLYIRDTVNSRMQMTITPGGSSSASTTNLASKLVVESTGEFNNQLMLKHTNTGSHGLRITNTASTSQLVGQIMMGWIGYYDDQMLVIHNGTVCMQIATGSVIANRSFQALAGAAITGQSSIIGSNTISSGLLLSNSSATLGRTARMMIGWPGNYDDQLLIYHGGSLAANVSDSSFNVMRILGIQNPTGTNTQIVNTNNGNNSIDWSSTGAPGTRISALADMRFAINYVDRVTLTNALFSVIPNATFSGHITSAFQSLSADPSTLDIASGLNRLVKNTTSGEIRNWVNDAGIMKKSPAYS